MIDRSTRSLLAVDLTTYGLAFVAFERGDLLDWGHRYFHSEDAKPLEIVDQLVDGTAADVLVMEAPDGPGCRRGKRIRELVTRIALHVRKRRIAVLLIDRSEVRRTWVARGLTTKEAMAAAIAAVLPELSPYVPPTRKITRTEDERVNLFDAASLALHASREPDTPLTFCANRNGAAVSEMVSLGNFTTGKGEEPSCLSWWHSRAAKISARRRL